MKIKKRVKLTTCWLLGLAGAALMLVAGVLLALDAGPAQLLSVAGFALTGGMILFLCTQESGPENKNRRLKLLGIFVLLVVAYLRLPPLDWLEVAVLPLVGAMYYKKGDGPFMLLVGLVEAGMAALRTLALTPLLGARPGLWLGVGMVVVALARAVMLLRLWRRGAAEPEKAAPPASADKLRPK